MKVLVTCPPMLAAIDEFRADFTSRNIELLTPAVVQTLSIDELKALVPEADGWIIGDDPACREVLEAGVQGRLRAAVKWGVGIDNVDTAAANELGLTVINTPGVFGREVADLAVSYVSALARDTFTIDREVRTGGWPKPRGASLAGKTVALVGYGDIGSNTARRLRAAEMNVIVYDPYIALDGPGDGLSQEDWPEGLGEADFIVFTCALTPANRHILDDGALACCKRGVRIVNVARGLLIDEAALARALDTSHVQAAALDVFEVEPLPMISPLRRFERCIFGSHNASNTEEAVHRTNEQAIATLFESLGVT